MPINRNRLRQFGAALQIAVAIAFVVGVAAAFTPTRAIPAAPPEECWTCERGFCGDGEHLDYVLYPASDNHWEGGTYHYLQCIDTYCTAAHTNHEECNGYPPVNDSLAVLALDPRKLLERVAAQPEAFAADPNRDRVEVIDCRGDIVASVRVAPFVAREVARLTSPNGGRSK